MPSQLAFLIETDPGAAAQMQRVLKLLDVGAVVAPDRESAVDLARNLSRVGSEPSLIIARVTTSNGSGLEILNEVAEFFPRARHILVSHYPRRLLLNIPGFTAHRGLFLQEAFTDEQFERAVRSTLCAPRAASS